MGFTKNVNERLKRHNTGKVKSTKHRRPFRLISFREFATLRETINYERRLKNR
ncbi:MAG: hypothetical protein FJZ10_03555 [Candidatus Omnitrophica bacterium]|nr:hypothetical protein [Candidatus Omnitrophota bacterium]